MRKLIVNDYHRPCALNCILVSYMYTVSVFMFLLLLLYCGRTTVTIPLNNSLSYSVKRNRNPGLEPVISPSIYLRCK